MTYKLIFSHISADQTAQRLQRMIVFSCCRGLTNVQIAEFAPFYFVVFPVVWRPFSHLCNASCVSEGQPDSCTPAGCSAQCVNLGCGGGGGAFTASTNLLINKPFIYFLLEKNWTLYVSLLLDVMCVLANEHTLVNLFLLSPISVQHACAVPESVIHEGECPGSILNEKRQQITALPALLLLSIYP